MDNLAEIRRRRVALGIPLHDLARAISRSDATVSRIERGQIQPTYELVQRIFAYLEGREGLASPPLQAREVMRGELVTVESGASLADAARFMEQGGYSQLPVVENGRITGSISESAVLRALAAPAGRRARVRDVQEGTYPQVDETSPADVLSGLFTRYPAVLVARRGEVVGIVTKTDLIRALRGTAIRRATTAPSASAPK